MLSSSTSSEPGLMVLPAHREARHPVEPSVSGCCSCRRCVSSTGRRSRWWRTPDRRPRRAGPSPTRCTPTAAARRRPRAFRLPAGCVPLHPSPARGPVRRVAVGQRSAPTAGWPPGWRSAGHGSHRARPPTPVGCRPRRCRPIRARWRRRAGRRRHDGSIGHRVRVGGAPGRFVTASRARASPGGTAAAPCGAGRSARPACVRPTAVKRQHHSAAIARVAPPLDEAVVHGATDQLGGRVQLQAQRLGGVADGRRAVPPGGRGSTGAAGAAAASGRRRAPRPRRRRGSGAAAGGTRRACGSRASEMGLFTFVRRSTRRCRRRAAGAAGCGSGRPRRSARG